MIKPNKTNGPESLCLGIPIIHYCYWVAKIVFFPKLLVFAVVRQAFFSHVANNIRDMIITIRKVHMKIPEDY